MALSNEFTDVPVKISASVPTLLYLHNIPMLGFLFYFLSPCLYGNVAISKQIHELDQPEGRAWFEVSGCSLVANSSIFIPF